MEVNGCSYRASLQSSHDLQKLFLRTMGLRGIYNALRPLHRRAQPIKHFQRVMPWPVVPLYCNKEDPKKIEMLGRPIGQ